ncbi:MAG: cobyrinate a,c-diamide synthase [Clostridia bacterium]|nr:cobyrinate a,c-diamide synthase [Clostridia bacterium]
MDKSAPRLLIAGTGSGSGKTTFMLAILQALVNRGECPGAFKCGPDYIDPMFYREILGTESGNIDLFFTPPETAVSLFLRHAQGLNLIEGVMGFYDGLAMDSCTASSYDVSNALNAPVLLVVNARGMAFSTAALVHGFCHLITPNNIAGVLLNGPSPSACPALRATIERECHIPVFGYLPQMPECTLESRHLGLITAQEVNGLKEKMQLLAHQAEKTIDINGILSLMQTAPPLKAEALQAAPLGHVRIAIARDSAFCFYYRENLDLLSDLGAELIPFSPLHDRVLPACDGLYIGGGYPELYAEALAKNETMRASVQEAVISGLPTIAECGGYMYLSETIDGHPMTGVLKGHCRNQGKLVRFGYVTLSSERESLLFAPMDRIRGHEFHHWDSDMPGTDLLATKPNQTSWHCAHLSDTLYAGFPHLFFPSNKNAAIRFIAKCLAQKGTHS